MPRSLRLLLVEDSENDAALVLRELQRGGLDVTSERVESRDAMSAALDRTPPWDLVISDYSLPTFDAPGAVALVRERDLDLPIIIVSGTIGEETAVAALKAGAQDFIVKNRLARLVPAVERELREAEARQARKVAERALQVSETRFRRLAESAQKMEAIGTLAGGIAHDFNNLLSVVLSYSSMMIADLKPADPMRADLEEVQAAGRRAADLTRQLLVFSRQQILQPILVDLTEIASQVERMLKRLIGEDIDLITTGAPALGKVMVDPSQVEQIIMNLAVNARDAMPDGGTLTIETADVVLDTAYATEHVGVTAGPHVMLAVTDTGTGMDKALVARIFEPFFTTKEKGKGTGLGLSIVFGIVEQSAGSIAVDSEPGHGTTFRIYFPRAEDVVDGECAVAMPTATTPRGVETILLVEDEEQVRKVARMILLRSGYDVLEAQSGGDALLLCEHHPSPIHLLLTDVVMPHMSGRQLADRLKLIRPEMKVLYMSGYADNAVIHHGILDTDIALLQKPLTLESLTRKVRLVLAQPLSQADAELVGARTD